MKIMNAEGRYVNKTVDNIPSKPTRKKLETSFMIYHYYQNLRDNSNANEHKACTHFIHGFSLKTGIPEQHVQKRFKQIRNQHSGDSARQRRLKAMQEMCTKQGFNINNLKSDAEYYGHVTSHRNWRFNLEFKRDSLEQMRADDPAMFYDTDNAARYFHIKKELRQNQPCKASKPKPRHHKVHHQTLIPKGVRIDLANLGNKKRYRFVGTFVRCGFKSTYHGNGLDRGDCYMPTLLLKDVKLAKTKQKVTDHLWFNYTKGFRRLGMLKAGDKVLFNARVSSYLKGYGPVEAKTRDYDLSFPTKVVRPKKVQRPKMPVDDKNSLIGYVMKKNKKFYLMNDRPYDSWYVKRYINWRNLK